MALVKSFPNEATDSNLVSTGSVSVGFEFNAGQVTFENLGAGAAYLSLDTTGAGSTGGFRLSSGARLEVRAAGAGIAGFAAAATSTANVLTYGAWG